MYESRLKQREVDWFWVKSKGGEKLILTHLPTGKKVEAEMCGSNYKGQNQQKKRELYETLFERLEELIYGPDQKRR